MADDKDTEALWRAIPKQLVSSDSDHQSPDDPSRNEGAANNPSADLRRSRHGWTWQGAEVSESFWSQHLSFSEPPKTQLIGNKYRISDKLGEGAMAIVYRGREEATGKIVAIKTLKFVEPNVVARFAREVEIHKKLKHENIVEAIDCITANGQSYFVMEFLKGRSIEDMLEAKGRFKNVDEIAEILSQICDALDHAHSKGVIHRDIKPENIFLVDGGTKPLVKVLDFGVAKIQEDLQRLTRTGVVLGSPAYMSPEQCMGEVIDSRSDLYSLGIVAYEMVTGALPFNALNEVEMMEAHCRPEITPIKLSQHRGDIPAMAELQAVFDKVLRTDSNERHQTIYHFKQELAVWWRLANKGNPEAVCPFKEGSSKPFVQSEQKTKKEKGVLNTSEYKSLDNIVAKHQRLTNLAEEETLINKKTVRLSKSQKALLGWSSFIALVLGLSSLVAFLLISLINQPPKAQRPKVETISYPNSPQEIENTHAGANTKPKLKPKPETEVKPAIEQQQPQSVQPSTVASPPIDCAKRKGRRRITSVRGY